MQRSARFTLAQAFVMAIVAISVVIGIALYGFVSASQRSILENAERLRDAAAQRTEARIRRDFDEAGTSLANIERSIRLGAVHADTPIALEPAIFSEMANHPRLADISFTHAEHRGYDADGNAVLDPENRWQLSVFRATPSPDSAVLTRTTQRRGEPFVSVLRERAPGGALEAPVRVEGAAQDPTGHPTFEVSASRDVHGRAIPSDLHYSEIDARLPEEERRVVVTIQKAIDDAAGHFLGVLRVGLRTQTIDLVARLKVNEDDASDPHRIFVCDAMGRLVTRLAPGERLSASNGDLRVVPDSLPPAIAKALGSARLREITAEHPHASDAFDVGGRRFLATFQALEGTQDWVVGIVVPEEYYTRDLRALRDRFLAGYGLLALVVLAGGGLALRALSRNLRRVTVTTSRMRDFDFAAAPFHAAFRDVEQVMDGLERAKTAMRALGKYVPVDLVRELYASNREPVLGGELRNVTLMFTDIRGFTNLAERLAPDALAQALGRYLDAMTNAIRESGGTIDKYIGDAVMALWNAPASCERHATRACSAALACIEATDALYASPAWKNLPPLFTRFGLHKDDVLVGHFGAPSRLSYTALGDGVNLAARLESLGKQYDVAILVSEAVEVEARDAFVFRLVDRVAVKGKTKPVRVFELLGAIDRVAAPTLEKARTYERALEAYFQRQFVAAQALLADQRDDGPSRVLHSRCQEMRANPPGETWDGVYVALSK